MTFASTLDAYCKAAGCTNRQISELSGMSPSNLSRYRRGLREPEPNSPVVRQLAEALAKLSADENPHNTLDADEIDAALESELAVPQMAGMDFNTRLDTLMRLVGIRNTDCAEVAGIDPSYVSRIRRGQRMPADMHSFAIGCAHLAAYLSIERGLLDDVGKLIEMPEISKEFSPDDANLESEIAEAIEIWLTGSEIVTTDTVEMIELFDWLDNTDFSEWLELGNEAPTVIEAAPEPPNPVARFYYGLGGMRSAEMEFISTAKTTCVHKLVLSSDIPPWQLKVDFQTLDAYMQELMDLVRCGTRIDIIFCLERPLVDTIRSLRLWTPLFLTGRVTPSFIKGVNNRLFCHVNRVCDTCVLSGESIMGHQEDGRYYYSTRPEDIAYYKRKMTHVIGKSSSLFEIYRECEPEQKKLFCEAEAARQVRGNGVRICEGEYENLSITSYPGDCTVLSLSCNGQPAHLVIRHPKINFIVARMK